MGSPDEDERQLADLVGRYAGLIRSVVTKVSRSRGPALADDVEQRVAEALWKQIRKNQTIERPASYIYRCAIRETVRLLEQSDEHAPDEAVPIAGTIDPEASARAKELELATATALEKLLPDRAAAV